MFTVGGFIVGPALPAEPLTIGAALIRRRQPGEHFPRGRPTSPRMDFEADDPEDLPDYFTVVPGDQFVHSRWVITFMLEAKNQDAAVDRVRDHLLPEVLGSLEVVGEDEYRVEIVRVVDNTTGQKMSPYSEWAGAAPEEIGYLTVQGIEEVIACHSTLSSGSVAEEAVTLLSDATLLHDSSGDHVRLLRAAVLNVYQAFERLIQEVARQETPKPDAQAVETEVNALREKLDREQRVESHVREIRKTNVELDKLHHSKTRAQLQVASSALAIPGVILAEAAKFVSFRNNRLGHPGRPPARAELNNWYVRGRAVARAYLHGYARRKGEHGDGPVEGDRRAIR